MIRILKDSNKVNVFLTLLFSIGIAVSAYVLYRMPGNLMIPYGYGSVFSTVYIVVGVSFAIGMLAITQALRYKKELIVYRDRESELKQGEQGTSDSEKGIISVENIKASLRTA